MDTDQTQNSKDKFSNLNKMVRYIIGLIFLLCAILVVISLESSSILIYLVAIVLLVGSVDCFLAAYKERPGLIERLGPL